MYELYVVQRRTQGGNIIGYILQTDNHLAALQKADPEYTGIDTKV